MLFSPCRKSFWQRRQGDFFVFNPSTPAARQGSWSSWENDIWQKWPYSAIGGVWRSENGHIWPSEVSGGVKMAIFSHRRRLAE